MSSGSRCKDNITLRISQQNPLLNYKFILCPKTYFLLLIPFFLPNNPREIKPSPFFYPCAGASAPQPPSPPSPQKKEAPARVSGGFGVGGGIRHAHRRFLFCCVRRRSRLSHCKYNTHISITQINPPHYFIFFQPFIKEFTPNAPPRVTTIRPSIR